MYVEDSEYMVIEACEYKRSFLQYHPYITVITNIDLDHLDYYRDIEDYISAFQSIVDQTSGYVLVSADCENSAKLHIPESKKIIIHTPNKTVYTSENTPYITYYPRVDEDIDGVVHTSYVEQTMQIPAMHLQVPGQHILHDAHLVYTVARLLQMTDTDIAQRLQSYTGSWRRSEVVGTTAHGNILMSDYGHHPSEIVPTLRALKQKYSDKKLYVVFQPHQYSRTRELLDDFATCWVDADMLVIPDIYFSRDRTEDVAYMTTDRLVRTISTYHPHVVDGK
jgi:UDP-N-acetylmuramate--alanine ligase